MTREEAGMIMNKVIAGTSDWSGRWLDAFEALGMLKLESKEDNDKKELLAYLCSHFSLSVVKEVDEIIELGGFKIVKTGPVTGM